MGALPALRAHRHGGTDAETSHRAGRVALTCEIISEDHITRSKLARGTIADPNFHLPRDYKDVLPPRRSVPIAEIIRREGAEREIGTRLTRNVVALRGRHGGGSELGRAVRGRVYPYNRARTPAHRGSV